MKKLITRCYNASRNNAAKLTYADDFNLLSVEQLIAEQAKPSGKRQTRSLFGKLKVLQKRQSLTSSRALKKQ